jgi:xylose isomerase
MQPKSLHAICRWTFNAGKGGFTPGDIRPDWSPENLDVLGIIKLIQDHIRPRLPEHVELGIEVHYDTEINEKTAPAIADALIDAKMYLAMITPGAHSHFGYGGIVSLDPKERASAETLGIKTVDLA